MIQDIVYTLLEFLPKEIREIFADGGTVAALGGLTVFALMAFWKAFATALENALDEFFKEKIVVKSASVYTVIVLFLIIAGHPWGALFAAMMGIVCTALPNVRKIFTKPPWIVLQVAILFIIGIAEARQYKMIDSKTQTIGIAYFHGRTLGVDSELLQSASERVYMTLKEVFSIDRNNTIRLFPNSIPTPGTDKDELEGLAAKNNLRLDFVIENELSTREKIDGPERIRVSSETICLICEEKRKRPQVITREGGRDEIIYISIHIAFDLLRALRQAPPPRIGEEQEAQIKRNIIISYRKEAAKDGKTIASIEDETIDDKQLHALLNEYPEISSIEVNNNINAGNRLAKRRAYLLKLARVVF